MITRKMLIRAINSGRIYSIDYLFEKINSTIAPTDTYLIIEAKLIWVVFKKFISAISDPVHIDDVIKYGECCEIVESIRKEFHTSEDFGIKVYAPNKKTGEHSIKRMNDSIECSYETIYRSLRYCYDEVNSYNKRRDIEVTEGGDNDDRCEETKT